MPFDTNVVDHYYGYVFDAGFALGVLCSFLVWRKNGYDFAKTAMSWPSVLRDPWLLRLFIMTMLVVVFVLVYPALSPTFCQNNPCKGHHGRLDPRPQAP